MSKENNLSKPEYINLDLLVLTDTMKRLLGSITSLAIFEPSSQRFEPKGLFSTDIFGPVSSKQRMRAFGYINLRAPVLHPLVYTEFINLKGFYGEVISGQRYGAYDNNIRDIVPATKETGRTGYQFVMECISKIDFKSTGSPKREERIKLVKKGISPEYRLKEYVVLPAGMRDYTIDDRGRPQEDEINTLYRRLLMITSMLESITVNDDTIESVDSIRYNIQLSINAIYDHISSLLHGKSKFIQGSFAKRGVDYGTRNVIVPSQFTMMHADDEGTLELGDTTMGLFQFCSGISPATKHQIVSKFSRRIFNQESSSARLVDTTTLRSKTVEINLKYRDEWITFDGIDNILNKLRYEDNLSAPVKVGEYYLLLVHDDGKTVHVIYDTDYLPDGITVNMLRPITYGELFYIAVHDIRQDHPSIVTRFPTINQGGTYPSAIYLKTTIIGRRVRVYIDGIGTDMLEYPKQNEDYYIAMSPHFAHLEALDGDHDGDKMSGLMVMTMEAAKELRDYINTPANYLNTAGSILNPMGSKPPARLTIMSMTKGSAA